MERENIPRIIKENPELLKDTNYLKLVLSPIELFVLKRFMKKFRQTNVGEIHSFSILILFKDVFGTEEHNILDFKEDWKLYAKNLFEEGYGRVNPEKKLKKETSKKLLEKSKNKSETKWVENAIDIFKQYKVKYPSYDKIRGVFKRFEEKEIIVNRGLNGKIITYSLNPYFYEKFKDKVEEIEKL